jgi:antitoxin MazE
LDVIPSKATAMHVPLRQIGNSFGVLLPKSFLTEAGLSVDSGVELTLEGAAIVLRRPAEPPRQGWAEAAHALAETGETAPMLCGASGQEDLSW